MAASLVVHAAVLVTTFAGGARGALQPPSPPTLEATLVTTTEVAAEIPDVIEPATPVLAAMTPSPSFAVPAVPATPGRTTPAARPAPRAGVVTMEVIAEPLADRTRLGEYFDRQRADFPIEIDRPPRIDGRIVARYPPDAARDAREDSVVVWAIVDASGAVTEAYAAEGSDEFAAAALAAVQAARFIPAENKLRRQPYPIALQFDFRAGSAAIAKAK